MNFNPESYIRSSAYQTPEGAIPDKIDPIGFAANLSALINPKGTLETKQNQQIAKSVSDLQVSSIYPEIQKKFIQSKQDYIKKYKALLSSHKGMGRLKLTAAEHLDMDTERQKLMNEADWANNATKSITEVNRDAIRMLQDPNSGFTSEDYQNWFKGYMDDIKKSPTGGDIPDAYTHFMNHVNIQKKPKLSELSKEEETLVNQFNKSQMGMYRNEEGEVVPGYNDKALIDMINTDVATKGWTDERKDEFFKRVKENWADPTLKALTPWQVKQVQFKAQSLAQGGNLPVQPVQNEYQQADGSRIIPAVDKVPRDIMVKGKLTKVEAVQAYKAPGSDDVSYFDVKMEVPDLTTPKPLYDKKGMSYIASQAEENPDDKVSATTVANFPELKGKKYSEAMDILRKNPKYWSTKMDKAQLTPEEAPALLGMHSITQKKKGGGTVTKKVPATQDKTKNPKYKGWDSKEFKDKNTGKIVTVIWDDKLGDYKYQ